MLFVTSILAVDALYRSLKTMKIFALLLALLPITALADVESSLGKSPDGRFELILTASSEKDYGRVIVRDLKSGATTETDSGQGYGYFPSGDVEAVWKDSSDAFAVTMRGTKRTWNTDVYIREGDVWEKLEFPPYVANILGRQGVFKSGRSFHEAFGGFQGTTDSHCLAILSPTGSNRSSRSRSPTGSQRRRRSGRLSWSITAECARIAPSSASHPTSKRTANNLALGNPLPALWLSRRVASNLNLKRRGAPGSGLPGLDVRPRCNFHNHSHNEEGSGWLDARAYRETIESEQVVPPNKSSANHSLSSLYPITPVGGLNRCARKYEENFTARYNSDRINSVLVAELSSEFRISGSFTGRRSQIWTRAV